MAEFLQGEIADRFLANSPLGYLPSEGSAGTARPFMLSRLRSLPESWRRTCPRGG